MNVTATLLGQMGTFAILVWFIMKFLWGPLINLMEDRKTRIAQGLEAAEKGRHEQELAKKRSVEVLRKAKEEAAGVIAKAEQRAARIVEDAKEEAKKEAKRIAKAAEADVGRELENAKEQLRAQMAGLVVAGAEKLLRKEISAAEHERLLDELAAEL